LGHGRSFFILVISRKYLKRYLSDQFIFVTANTSVSRSQKSTDDYTYMRNTRVQMGFFATEFYYTFIKLSRVGSLVSTLKYLTYNTCCILDMVESQSALYMSHAHLELLRPLEASGAGFGDLLEAAGAGDAEGLEGPRRVVPGVAEELTCAGKAGDRKVGLFVRGAGPALGLADGGLAELSGFCVRRDAWPIIVSRSGRE
jgi:hypothetical protein